MVSIPCSVHWIYKTASVTLWRPFSIKSIEFIRQSQSPGGVHPLYSVHWIYKTVSITPWYPLNFWDIASHPRVSMHVYSTQWALAEMVGGATQIIHTVLGPCCARTDDLLVLPVSECRRIIDNLFIISASKLVWHFVKPNTTCLLPTSRWLIHLSMDPSIDQSVSQSSQTLHTVHFCYGISFVY